MSGNSIRKLRATRGISQRQLAALAGTSQQQIQRIESGLQAAKVEIALRICSALGEPLERVFPGTRRALSKLGREKGRWSDLAKDEAVVTEMESAGIDMDPEVWTLRFRLRSGIEAFLRISGVERKRLWKILQHKTDGTFFIFDATEKRVAINPRHLLFWQFLFDPPTQVPETEGEARGALSVYLANSAEPMSFGIDGDTTELDREEEDEDATQLQHTLSMLELCGDEADTIISFVDCDRERSFFRSSEVAMIEIPLWAVEPRLEQADDTQLK